MAILPKQKVDGLKTGASKADQVTLLKLYSEGVEAEEISKQLRIKLDCVKSFLPKPKKKAATKKKAKKTKED